MTKPIANARKTLIAQGREVLLSRGYRYMSIAKLTRDCGMAAGTFYTYFGSKEELAISIVDEDWRHVLDAIEQMDAGLSFHDKLEKIDGLMSAFQSDLYGAFRQIPLNRGEGLTRRAHRADEFRKQVEVIVSDEFKSRGIVASAQFHEDVVCFIVEHFASVPTSGWADFEGFYRCLTSMLAAVKEAGVEAADRDEAKPSARSTAPIRPPCPSSR